MNELIPGPTAPLMSATAGRDDPFQFKYGYNFQNEVQGPPIKESKPRTGMVLPGPQGPFHIHSEINRVGGWAKFNSNGRLTYPALRCAYPQSR